MQVKVGVVDDHQLFREALRSLLARTPDFAVVGEAATAPKAREMVASAQPDVVMLDLLLPDMPGVELARQLLIDNPRLRLLAVSMVSDPAHVAEALDAGCLGFVSKEDAATELVAAVHAVADRQAYMSPRLQREAVEALRGHAGPRGLHSLTPREREIFDLTVAGASTIAVAQQLSISPRTVETHRSRILRKLDMHGATDMVLYAARLGLLQK
jgi:DNA-binding NarL/FixJ family response regulator